MIYSSHFLHFLEQLLREKNYYTNKNQIYFRSGFYLISAYFTSPVMASKATVTFSYS